MKNTPRLLLIGLLALLVVAAGAGCGKRPTPGDIVLAQPDRAVAEARRLIEEKRADPKLYPNWIEPHQLPEALRFPKLKCGIVHEDHMDLLIQRMPDWWVGARIWSANATRAHADAPTAYSNVFFFTYTNDEPDSPSNIR
ncbi:MAG: hypothetical protein HY343_00245 [Lentisphaerae bacterium]|nr:hypothetical protein [Lentisphaerota bacterium]